GAVIPRRHAPGFPGVPVPGSEVRLAWLRDRVEAPEALAGLRVISIEEAIYSVLPAGHTDDQFVLHHQRRTGRRIAAGCSVIAHFGLPDFVAGSGVHRYDVHVERIHEQRVAQYREAAVHFPAAVERTRWITIFVHP